MRRYFLPKHMFKRVDEKIISRLRLKMLFFLDHFIWIYILLACLVGLNNIYSDKVHDIHKYNVKIVGSDSKPVAYLDHLLDML